SSRRRHTRFDCDWSSNVCSSDLHTLAALAATVASPLALAQAKWPTKPVRIVVPFGAGGVADLTARAVGQKLTEQLGQSFIIDNQIGRASCRERVQMTGDGGAVKE